MKFLFVFLTFFISTRFLAQQLQKEELIGQWKGVTIEATKDLEEDLFIQLKDMYENSVFQFKDDGNAV